MKVSKQFGMCIKQKYFNYFQINKVEDSENILITRLRCNILCPVML